MSYSKDFMQYQPTEMISSSAPPETDFNSSSADDRTERHPRIREKGSWAALLRKMKTEPGTRLCQKYSVS